MKINSVDDVACSINECSVLALHDAILLRCVWSRELMCDAQCIKISVEASALEFSAVVTRRIKSMSRGGD